MQGLEKILEDIDDYQNEMEESGIPLQTGWVKNIIRKHMNDGWIPVGKGLPEENTAERYIITDTGGCIWSEMWYGYVEESDDAPCFYRWDDDMWQCLKIHAIAWRPLPEPYQPETVPQRPEWKDRMLHTFLGGHE